MAFAVCIPRKINRISVFLFLAFILDEPFNGVDLKGCILMKRLIRQLKAKEKTVIISSHLIASLREICDIIHYLNEGGIYKEYHEETTEEIEEDILCNTKS